MIEIKGVGVCSGVTFGKIKLHLKEEKPILRVKVSDTSKEVKRFEYALERASNQLKRLYEKALSEVGENEAMIFDTHKIMLEDRDFLDFVISNITNQRLNAESAVAIASDNFAEMFSSMNDSYMQARATDVRDICERLINLLTGKEVKAEDAEPKILVAQDLSPSETVQMDKSKILAFVTQEGSANSHTAILARTMDIPAIILAKGILDVEYDGKDVIVDGFTGMIYINPNMETVLKMQKKKQESEEQKALLESLKGVLPVTKDGKKVLLYANIGSLSDMVAVYKNDAMGVGLFRSEFVYLERETFPTEDEQFSIYKEALLKALGKKVIIRTLDIGADKNVDYFKMPKEDNPAMGVRAIRYCLTRPDIFKTQLRALLRASAFGNLSVMFPMITSVSEVKKVKEMLNEVKEELKKEHISFDENVETGIMIETPSSAIISDLLAKEVDFFSIGTNDLTQYTLALDRQNSRANEFLDTHHEAVLRLIKMTVENAHKEGVWVGICGELAGDLTLTETFLEMGIDELSVTPSLLLPLKQKIINTNLQK